MINEFWEGKQVKRSTGYSEKVINEKSWSLNDMHGNKILKRTLQKAVGCFNGS